MAIKTTSHDLNLDDMNKQDQSARWKRKWENELKPSDHVSKGSRNHKKAILLYMLSSALFAFSMIGNFVSNLRTDFIAATVNNPISNNDLLDLSPNFVSDVNITTCEPLKVVEEIVIEDNLEQIKIFSEQISELKRLSLELSMTNSRLTEYIHQYNNLTHAVFAISSQIEYVTKRQGDIRGHLNSLEDSVTNIRALEAAVNLYPARLSTLDSRLSDIASIRISAEKHILINHNLQQRSESYSRMVAQSLKHAESIHKSYELRLRALEHENNILVESCNLSRIQNIIYDSLSHMREEEVEDDRKRVATYQTEESEAVFHENILTNVSMPWIDFASAKLGGEIVTSMTSATYFPKNAHPPSLDFLSSLRIPTDSAALIFKMIYGTLGIDLGVGKPEDAIDEDMSLGSCWPLQGSEGILTIKLKHPISLAGVSIDHVLITEAVDISSAPKDFQILVASALSGPYRSIFNGTYLIDDGRGSRHTFRFGYQEPIQYISLNILSNHGHPNYTCLYRFRVHGTLAT